jgi:hypothetical protein
MASNRQTTPPEPEEDPRADRQTNFGTASRAGLRPAPLCVPRAHACAAFTGDFWARDTKRRSSAAPWRRAGPTRARHGRPRDQLPGWRIPAQVTAVGLLGMRRALQRLAGDEEVLHQRDDRCGCGRPRALDIRDQVSNTFRPIPRITSIFVIALASGTARPPEPYRGGRCSSNNAMKTVTGTSTAALMIL